MDGENGSMPIYWSQQCTFVLNQYIIFQDRVKTMHGDLWLFVLGCFATAVLAVLSTYSYRLKRQIVKCFSNNTFQQQSADTERKPINSESINMDVTTNVDNTLGLSMMLLLYYIYYSFMHILMMLLIMTMNGYVIVSIIFGLAVGNLLFEESLESAVAREDDMPVNCGACS